MGDVRRRGDPGSHRRARPGRTLSTSAAPAPELCTGAGADARLQRSKALDAWLLQVYGEAGTSGVALVAVGGLGRRECAPRSDLDLVLLHDGRPGVDELATRIWYAIWDAKFALDHSTRTPYEALALAGEDLKVALGLLDARLLAGDATLVADLHTAAVTQWRREARRLLPALQELTEERWAAHGEL